MTALVTAFGALLIISALVDVFQTLFHPASHGAMSDWIAKNIWKIFRKTARCYPKMLTLAGPAALVFIIADWVVFTVFGFAMVYWAHLQQPDFSLSSFWTSLVNSVEALSTISEGKNFGIAWIKIASGIEALIGFGIVTASVSWLLSIYPIIESRRSLAHKATLLHDAEKKTGLDLLLDNADDASAIMTSVANDLSVLRNQMSQFPITYYFYVGEPKTNLAAALPYLADLANRAVQKHVAQHLTIPATILRGALSDFSLLLAGSFLQLKNCSEAEIFSAYARELMCEPVSLAWRKQRDPHSA